MAMDLASAQMFELQIKSALTAVEAPDYLVKAGDDFIAAIKKFAGEKEKAHTNA